MGRYSLSREWSTVEHKSLSLSLEFCDTSCNQPARRDLWCVVQVASTRCIPPPPLSTGCTCCLCVLPATTVHAQQSEERLTVAAATASRLPERASIPHRTVQHNSTVWCLERVKVRDPLPRLVICRSWIVQWCTHGLQMSNGGTLNNKPVYFDGSTYSSTATEIKQTSVPRRLSHLLSVCSVTVPICTGVMHVVDNNQS